MTLNRLFSLPHLAAASCLWLAACGNVPYSGPPVNAAGTYLGSWHSSSLLSGNLQMVLTQNGGQNTGTATLTGTFCALSSATVAGTVNGNQVTAALTGGSVTVNLSGIVNAGDLLGSFSTSGGGVCGADSGSFDLQLEH